MSHKEVYESYNISSFIDDLLPEHVNSNYPELVEFMKTYAFYLEQVSDAGFYLNQIDQQRDIDLIEDHLLNELQNEIGTPIPRTFAADPRLFYRHLSEFYRSRGTPESIRSFFKLIYNDDVEIYFPKDDMLIPSDGKWFDQTDDIINHYNDHTPVYTFTITSDTYQIEFNDDNGYKPKFDDDIVFVNDTYVDTVEKVLYDDVNEEIDHCMLFTDELEIGDIVKVYRRGLFTTADGFTDDKKYIQDSLFYQKFSYVLQTGKNITEWKNAFTRLVHPAGFIFFGEILIFINLLDEGSPLNQPGFQKEGLPRTINIMPVSMGGHIFNEIGSYPEKEYHHASRLNRFGAWDHFENTKFVNWRPIYEYSDYTVDDIINKNIGTQFGCLIEES